MKKLLILEALLILLIACSSVEQHNGRQSVLMNTVAIEPRPLQADIQVGKAISGVAECETWFGFITKQPQKQTYGVDMQEPQGNYAPNACTRGAVYDALSKSNADVIVAPRYTSIKKKNWCILGLCLHSVDQIIVSGYKGDVVNLRPMDEEIVKKRRLNMIQDSAPAKKRGIFGLF